MGDLDGEQGDTAVVTFGLFIAQLECFGPALKAGGEDGSVIFFNELAVVHEDNGVTGMSVELNFYINLMLGGSL
jgi:hypothetical protein